MKHLQLTTPNNSQKQTTVCTLCNGYQVINFKEKQSIKGRRTMDVKALYGAEAQFYELYFSFEQQN